MKRLFFALICSLLTASALASGGLLPKRASLISASGSEAVLDFGKFNMDQVRICEGSTSFVYGPEYQYRSSFVVEFNGDTFRLFNFPCAQNPVNLFYYNDDKISGAEFWFVKDGGRETLSIRSSYQHIGIESKVETLNLFYEGLSYTYEINRTGTVSEWPSAL